MIDRGELMQYRGGLDKIRKYLRVRLEQRAPQYIEFQEGIQMFMENLSILSPATYVQYEGAFLLELVEGATTSVVPPSAILDGNKIFVLRGRIKQTVGGLQLHSCDERFYYGLVMIKEVRDGTGRVLWSNESLH